MKISKLNYKLFLRISIVLFIAYLTLSKIINNFDFERNLHIIFGLTEYVLLQLAIISFAFYRFVIYSIAKKYKNMLLESLCVIVILIIMTLKLFIKLGNYRFITLLCLAIITISMINYSIYRKKLKDSLQGKEQQTSQQ